MNVVGRLVSDLELKSVWGRLTLWINVAWGFENSGDAPGTDPRLASLGQSEQTIEAVPFRSHFSARPGLRHVRGLVSKSFKIGHHHSNHMIYKAAPIDADAVEVTIIHSFYFLRSGVNTQTPSILVFWYAVSFSVHESYPNANIHASFYDSML